MSSAQNAYLLENKQIKNDTSYISTYLQDFVLKSRSKIDSATEWDIKLRNEGLSSDQIFGSDSTDYKGNMSTSTDLVYNHLTKGLSGSVPRRWRFRMDSWVPQQDLTRNYGPITNYGITQFKKQTWEETPADSSRTAMTLYQESFSLPCEEDYKFKRHATPKSNSSTMVTQNKDTVNWKLRDMPMCVVSNSENLVLVCKEVRCNPITWQCPTDLKIPKRCI